VGAAEIVDTDHPHIPYVIAAPTMRVPMILRDTVNVYLAARAALLLARHGTFAAGSLAGEPVSAVVDSIAFPGLGTGVGQVDPDTCARQVRVAIEEIALGRRSFPLSWADAQARHQRLYTDGVRDLQRE
jgi:O-acetyl-ADP-ribose deacetylase (regulator of RNase III)